MMSYTNGFSASRRRGTLRRWVMAGLHYVARVAAAGQGRVWDPSPIPQHCDYSIRNANPADYSLVGQLVVDVYGSLPGMPGVLEQPDYYGVLRDVAKRARNPVISVFVAASKSEVLGSVDFIADMTQYGSGGAAGSITNAAGVRYLAVKPEFRGNGIGRSLTAYCVDRARELGKSAVILHTTRPMATAWAMYSRMGFQRYAEIDFRQGTLDVFGFRLELEPRRSSMPVMTVPPSGSVNGSSHMA